MELGTAEKQNIKSALFLHIEKNPVRAGASQRLSNIKREKPRLNILEVLSLRPIFIKNMAIALIIVLLVSGGASYAAEGALPGGVLYPIKVGINEEVVAALTFNSESKANWNARIAERRLEEAEELAAGGGLSADARAKIEANFDKHAERVQARIVRFETEKNLKAASDIGSNFETSLRAHENILNRIAENKTETEAEVKQILKKVKTKIKESEAERNRVEAKVEARTNGEFKAAAAGKMGAAENKITEARGFIGKNGGSVNTETAGKADAELKLAESAVTDGKTKMGVEAYGEAFVFFQKAIRIAQNAKLIMQAEKTFEIEIGIPSLHLRGEGQSKVVPPEKQNRGDETMEKKSESNGSLEVEVETKASVESDDSSTKTEMEGEVNIDIGL